MCGATRLAKVKCIAILQIIVYMIYLIATLVAWIYTILFDDRVKIYYHLGYITFLTIGVIGGLLAVVLFQGARKESITKCWFWFYGNSIYLGLFLVVAIFAIIFTNDLLVILGNFVAALITMYLLFVVYGYMMEFTDKLENPSVFVISNNRA